MKQKENYTLEELCTGLAITLTKFCQMAGITEGTLIRLRQGYAGRRSTINSILATFSRIYGIEFSLENVTGLTPQEKPHQKSKKQPVLAMSREEQSLKESHQISTVERKKADVPDNLPKGTIKLVDFKKQYGIADSSMNRWIHDGINGEKIETVTRPKPTGIGPQHYLTPAQQEKALDVLKRHGKIK